MFDWNIELEAAKRRVTELEELASRLKDALRQAAEGESEGTPVGRILERAQRTLTIRMTSLERARQHQRFIEDKIAARAKPVERLPYLELAETCFKAARWLPPGEDAESVRRTGAAFYTKAIAHDKTPPGEAKTKAMFDDIAAGWAPSTDPT
jgi:hypothetical protein